MHLIFDFDGTITKKDTIGTLAQAGIDAQRARNGSNLQQTWDKVVEAYMADYNAYKANYSPVEERRTSLSEEITYLSGLKSAEEASLDRVSRSGIFAGLQEGDFELFGRDAIRNGAVELRSGFSEILQLAQQKGWPVSVLSVNWSHSFISGVLGQLQQHIKVVANRIDESGTIHGPQKLGGNRLTCSTDKLRALKEISSEGCVYFGDSTTDLECLVHHNGVVIASGEETSLMKTLQRINVPPIHASKREKENLVWAATFDEVIGCGILGE
ncbi:hypothetical protein K4F52_002358 [Lecanicillium sp. MT-2017a]|nr:hypothetical protein K4F52_002358 [Lecanicillium sp. MT-2017a]